MRAELLYESAVDELKKKLPSLRKIDYSTIDNLMQRISKRYKITGKKLHDLFVSKYGHTPDTWIKKYKEKLGEEGVAEDLSEARNSLFAFVKQQFPTWPDYVLKDFLYPQAKGIRDQAELDDFLKRNKQDFGNCKWTLTKLPITFDIFTPKTQRMLASREGGSSNPFQVPRDAERHAQQSQMIQQKGVSAEPIIVAKLSNGYDLIEGWHRTIQHLKAFPQGYTGPAWVCTGATYKSESVEQGVAEGLDEAVGGNYLYHATSASGLKGMLSSGSIRSARAPQAATSAQTKLPTVSVTRDWGYANGVNAQTQMVSIGRDAILVLDRNAVESNFKTLGTSQSTNIKGLAFNPYLTKNGVARSQNTDPMARNIAKAKAKNAEPTAKAGGEFEEAVVVPKGALPLKGTMVGFWVNPKSELMKDPSIMNDPRRLDMVRPNQFTKATQTQGVAEDWQKVNKSDKTDGMSGKAVKAYRRENPGSKLKTAVTTKPSKLKKGSKAASRRKSFCARMGGMKKHNASVKTKRDPDSPINKALRRWNCESIEELQQLTMIAEQKIAEAKNPAMQAAIAIAKKKERMKEGEVLQFPNKQQPTKPNVSPLQKKKQVTQRTTSQNVVPIAKKPAGITWKKLPKDVLKLANDWFWADMEDGGSAAVLDPKGYGSGTRNQLQFITAQLQQRGWNIDHDEEVDNVLLTNKTGQSVLLPRDDAYDFKGWAAGTNSHLRESIEQKDDVQKIKNFIKWSMITLNIEKPYPKFTLSRDTEQAQKGHRTGMHTGDRIWVYIENRNLVDIFRTIFHELVHHRQDQLGMIKHGDSYPGSPIEALADMMAGKYIKIYGKEHSDIFQ